MEEREKENNSRVDGFTFATGAVLEASIYLVTKDGHKFDGI